MSSCARRLIAAACVSSCLVGHAQTPHSMPLTREVLEKLKSTTNDPGGDSFVDTRDRLNALVDAFAADCSLASPTYLYIASNTASRLGRVEDAAFLLYAAQLRKAFDFRRYDISPQADGNNLATYLGFLNQTTGMVVNPAVMRQPALFASAIARIEAWEIVPAPRAYYPEFAEARGFKLDRSAWPDTARAIKDEFLTEFGRRTAKLLNDREYFEAFSFVQRVNLGQVAVNAPDTRTQVTKSMEAMSAAEKRLFGSGAAPAAAGPAAVQRVLGEADARAVCAPLDRYVPGPLATPAPADRQTFASESFCADYIYRLVGDELDYDKARRCCLVKGDCNRELGMLFANGWGVKRDYDAATYFLCRADKEMAPAEQWGMLEHVRDMRAGTETKDLTYCDHVTSGRGMLFCEQLTGSQKAGEWETRLEPVRSALDPAARAAFAQLEKAATTFADAESGRVAEGSRGGTGYAAFAVEAQTAAYEGFVAEVEKFSKTRAPAVTAAALSRADAALNTVYRDAMKTAEPCPLCNADDPGTRNTLRDAQRAWIAYRDGWAAFYRARWKAAAAPDALDREIRAALTLERTKQLSEKP